MNDERHEHEHPEVPGGLHPEVPAERESDVFRKWWVGGWISPLLVAGFTVFWTLLIFWLIGDRPTDWKYGTVPYVPGESIFAIQPPPPGPPPPQVVLPEELPEDENEEE